MAVTLEAEILCIMDALMEIALHPEVRDLVPDAKETALSLREAIQKDDNDRAEFELVSLYSKLHATGVEYSPYERELLRKNNSYGCYAGGISPIIKAGQVISKTTVSMDLGAGNGLQGLLLQRLYPHRKTIQVEISKKAINTGRLFQKALNIPEERVEWICDDIINVSFQGVDFIYIYRPAKPEGSGLHLYKTIAEKLITLKSHVVVFSVADCLYELVKDYFQITYYNGHLTCFSNRYS